MHSLTTFNRFFRHFSIHSVVCSAAGAKIRKIMNCIYTAVVNFTKILVLKMSLWIEKRWLQELCNQLFNSVYINRSVHFWYEITIESKLFLVEIQRKIKSNIMFKGFFDKISKSAHCRKIRIACLFWPLFRTICANSQYRDTEAKLT